METTICFGFESARGAWRAVGRSVAREHPATDVRPPLLVRLLFDRGKEPDVSGRLPDSEALSAPERVSAAELASFREACGEVGHIHLCVSRQSGRRFFDKATTHLLAGTYPAGSFCRTKSGPFVCSPELCFVQMARVLSQVELVEYGYELCGYYAMTPESPMGFCNCPPLTSTARIASYLDSLASWREERGQGMPHGVKRARRALAFVRDGAASPEESIVSMVLTLPVRLGGYGIEPPLLNEVVSLGSRASRVFGERFFVCDMSWPALRVALEYQGAQHKQRSRQVFDLRKGNVLAADGWTVIELNRAMLERHDLMEEVAKSLTCALGKRWRAPSAQAGTRQLRMRRALLDKLPS